MISIAPALAAKGATGLYDLVKKKFSKDPEAVAELEAAKPDEPETVAAVAERLETATEAAPEFAEALHAEWEKHQAVINQFSGTAENVVQARDIQGGVHFP